MHANEECFDEDFIIWNPELGVRDFVSIGHVEKEQTNTNAWLEEPYEMVGPFCFDELCQEGKISFAACVVMSQKRWQKDQVLLYEESFRKKQEAQIRFNEEIRKHNNRRRQYHINIEQDSQKEHRELLCLPLEGTLKVSQIKAAYKKVAKRAHPDAGGSHEMFIKLTLARDTLLGE